MASRSHSRCHKPWRGLPGPCSAVIRQEQVCAGGWPCLPLQGAPSWWIPMPPQLLPNGQVTKMWVSVAGTAGAGLRADVLSPRARACPAQDCPDALLAMQGPPRRDALVPVQALVGGHTPHLPQGTDWCALLPRCPVMQVIWLRWRPLLQRLLGHCCAAMTAAAPIWAGQRWVHASRVCGRVRRLRSPPRLPAEGVAS